MCCGLDLTWWLGDVSIHSETSCPCVVGLSWHDDWVMCPFIVKLLVRVVWAWTAKVTEWCVHSYWGYSSICCGPEYDDWVVCPCLVRLMVTSHNYHVSSSPPHLDIKSHHAWTYQPVIICKPTGYGQAVSLCMDTPPGHHVSSSPHHMDK